MNVEPRQLWNRQAAGLNVGFFAYALSAVVAALALAMILVGIVGLARDGRDWQWFVVIGLGAAAPAIVTLVVARPPGATPIIRARDVFLTVTACWSVAALLSAVPIWIEGDARSYPSLPPYSRP